MRQATAGNERALRLPGTAPRQQPSEADWRKLDAILAPHYAGGLFTVLQIDGEDGPVRRSYSSNPAAYPCGGSKQMRGTPWAKRVIDEARPFIASNRDEMEATFSDYRLLFNLGCTTALNIPIWQGSHVAWAVNVLRGGAAYTDEESLLVRSVIENWIVGVCRD